MDPRVEQIAQETLTPIVRRALSQPAAIPTSWEITPVHGGWGSAVGGTAVYRVAGQTEAGAAWSLILKLLYERPGEPVDAPYYWKREYELYRSKMLDALPDTGLTTPLIYHCAEYPGGEYRGSKQPGACWIWMQELQREKRPWDWADLRLIARRLGRFNGAYLRGHELPAYPWLSERWHCQIVPPLADVLEHLDDYLDNPLAQIALPASEQAAIEGIWAQRERLMAALAELPQTLCHLDVYPGNFFHSQAETALIDWALAGRAAVGEELVCFVSLSLYSPRISLDQAGALDQTLFAGYLDGLRDAGWTGDGQAARLGYVCAMVLRGLAGVKQDLTMLCDESRHAFVMRGSRFETIEALAEFWAGIRRFRLLTLAQEAQALLGW